MHLLFENGLLKSAFANAKYSTPSLFSQRINSSNSISAGKTWPQLGHKIAGFEASEDLTRRSLQQRALFKSVNVIMIIRYVPTHGAQSSEH